MAKNHEEWLRQADYDMDTAEYMFKGERYFYAVFMCHLSIEKALKGAYLKRYNALPSNTNNLLFLIEKVHLKLPDDFSTSVTALNRMSVFPYYPDNLQRMLKDYDRERTKKIFEKGKEVLNWIKTKLQK